MIFYIITELWCPNQQAYTKTATALVNGSPSGQHYAPCRCRRRRRRRANAMESRTRTIDHCDVRRLVDIFDRVTRSEEKTPGGNRESPPPHTFRCYIIDDTTTNDAAAAHMQALNDVGRC